VADTFIYFLAGYLVIFGLLGAYIGWLLVLNRQLKKKIDQKKEESR
jgi:hypothetical protein